MNRDLKIYEVVNRATGEKHYAATDSAQDACEQAGWLIGDCYVRELIPIRKPGQLSDPRQYVRISCHVCPYQYAECIKPADKECPVRPNTPDIYEWMRKATEAHLCQYTGQVLTPGGYKLSQKLVLLQEMIDKLPSSPSPAPPN